MVSPLIICLVSKDNGMFVFTRSMRLMSLFLSWLLSRMDYICDKVDEDEYGSMKVIIVIWKGHLTSARVWLVKEADITKEGDGKWRIRGSKDGLHQA
jgi:hypothetical protein